MQANEIISNTPNLDLAELRETVYKNAAELIVSSERNSPLVAFAKRELPGANGDERQELINRQILEMVALFSAQDHSGHSASYAVKALELLLRFERLGPLTGDNDEWMEVHENENVQQN